MAFEIASVYFKKRADFGHECKHEHSQAMCIVEHAPTDESENLLKQTSIVRNLDTKPVVAQYRANTERKSYVNQGMTHLEGGWPKDVDASEQSDIARFRKRVEKNEVGFRSVCPVCRERGTEGRGWGGDSTWAPCFFSIASQLRSLDPPLKYRRSSGTQSRAWVLA